jgi:hypothetical protein
MPLQPKSRRMIAYARPDLARARRRSAARYLVLCLFLGASFYGCFSLYEVYQRETAHRLHQQVRLLFPEMVRARREITARGLVIDSIPECDRISQLAGQRSSILASVRRYCVYKRTDRGLLLALAVRHRGTQVIIVIFPDDDYPSWKSEMYDSQDAKALLGDKCFTLAVANELVLNDF